MLDRCAMIAAATLLALVPQAALAQDGDALAEQVAALTERLARVEDELAIRKLQSRYAHLLLTEDYDEILELFPEDIDEVSVEFSDSGVYRGRESVTKLYEAFEVTKTLPGFFIMHMTVNPVIEVAADRRTARSHWLSPGATGGARSAGWVWGLYYVDYVKEDGFWKIQHSNLAPIFRNRYEESWADAESHGTVRGILDVEPDAPTTIYRPFDEAKEEPDIFSNHPELPEPY